MDRDSLRQWTLLLLALGQVVVAVMSNTGRFGPTIGDLSRQNPTAIVPAGYAFSIWSLIYAACLVFAIDQAFTRHRRDPLLRRLGWPIASTFAATLLWVLVFQRQWFGLSVIVIVWLLISLAVTMSRIVRYGNRLRGVELWIVYGTFSLFLGWVTIATAANIAHILTAWGVTDDRASGLISGIFLLSIAGLCATAATWMMRGNLPYAAAVLWGLAGIVVGHWHSERPAAIAAIILAALIAIAIPAGRMRRRSRV